MIDPDVAPLVSELEQDGTKLRQSVIAQYQTLNPDLIATSFSLEEQAKLNLAGAYTTLSALYCQRRLKNQPIDSVLQAKLEQVKDYMRKVKATELRQVTPAERKELKERDRKRAATETETGLELALNGKRPRINIEAANRLASNLKE